MRRLLLWIKYRPALFGKYGNTPANRCWLRLWRFAVERIDRRHEKNLHQWQIKWRNWAMPALNWEALEMDGPKYRYRWTARLGALLRNVVDALAGGQRDFFVVPIKRP